MERLDIHHGAFSVGLILEHTAAVRATLGPRDDDDLVGLFSRDALPSMARMSGPGSTHGSGSFTPGGIGFNGQFGRRSRRSEEAFLGAAFLIPQTRFEPSVFFPKTINLLLLLQAVRAITQAVEARS